MAAGIVTLVLSIVWRQPNLLLNLTFSSFDLTGMLSRLRSLEPLLTLRRWDCAGYHLPHDLCEFTHSHRHTGQATSRPAQLAAPR